MTQWFHVTVESPAYFAFVLILWLLALVFRSPRSRQVLLLLGSYLFYAVGGLGFLACLIGSSLLNYGYGAFLRRRPTAARLWGGVMANLLFLGYFKYLPLLGGIAGHEWALSGWLHRIVMPIGVSFWTFQALSYLFEVYREEPLDPSLIEFLLYMAFWPTVISGPICRLPQMLPQFRQASGPVWGDVPEGVRRILMGLLMKVVLAQLLWTGGPSGRGVAAGFDEIKGGWGGGDVWLLAIGFGFQLYFDFAGYSHIVIGTARLFGFTLPENFDHPFLSTTPSMLWTRWHMSLSFWIRDYLFLPLATLRRESWWRHVALIISMTAFGLWHKGSVLFAIWGAYQGILLVIHRQIQRFKRAFNFALPARLEAFFSWPATWAGLSLGWIFFRANNVKQASAMLQAVVSPGSYHHSVMGEHFGLLLLLLAGEYMVVSMAGAWMAKRRTTWQDYAKARKEYGRTGEWACFLWGAKDSFLIPVTALSLAYGILVIAASGNAVSPFIYGSF